MSEDQENTLTPIPANGSAVPTSGQNEITIEPYGNRFWGVYAGDGLVCVCVYKKGAAEVKRRLTAGGEAVIREPRQIALSPETPNTHQNSAFQADGHSTTAEEERSHD